MKRERKLVTPTSDAGIELKYIKRSKLFRVWEYGLLPEESKSKSPEGGLGVPCHHVRIHSDLSLFLIWQKLVWSESRFYLNWSESGFHLNQSESGSYLNWSKSGSYLNRSESGFCSDHLKDCIWIDPGFGIIQIPDGFNQNFIWRDLNPDTEVCTIIKWWTWLKDCIHVFKVWILRI